MVSEALDFAACESYILAQFWTGLPRASRAGQTPSIIGNDAVRHHQDVSCDLYPALLRLSLSSLGVKPSRTGKLGSH
jgi:hypothetical protein